MTEESSPTSPAEFEGWINELEQKWLAGLIPSPRAVAIIITNLRGEVLLQLRDHNPAISFPNSWSLPGGFVESNEKPDDAARRELAEETSMGLNLSFWKVYERKSKNRAFTIKQHIYTAVTDYEVAEMIVGEGQALQYFERAQLSQLSFAYEFDDLLKDFFDQSVDAG